MEIRKFIRSLLGLREPGIGQDPGQPPTEGALGVQEATYAPAEGCGHGHMEFRFQWREKEIYLRLYGGPYMEKPANLPAIKMAEEIRMDCQIACDTKDFSVPHIDSMRYAIYQLLDACWHEDYQSHIWPQEWYVGCMGGIGRTGLFLACFQKAVDCLNGRELVDANNIVSALRKNYHRSAVETGAQVEFLRAFTMPSLICN